MAMTKLTPEEEYKYSREAVVICAHRTCRDEWNAEHPDDKISKAESDDWWAWFEEEWE
jgi:hypothetical protein